ncbi:hypothetical protein NST70_01800 [Weizmannia sp. FSL K6-0777]|uniref:hypothetical protein n=1 Tax=Weizmannia sp. FSL K6-0777 TaxID=2954674 RepID=UPI0031583DAC
MAWLVFGMSFWRLQKAKSGLGSVRNVFFESSKGQKESGQRLKCPFGGFGTTEKVNLKIQNNYMYNKLKKNTPSIWYNKVILQTKTKLGVSIMLKEKDNQLSIYSILYDKIPS